MYILQGTVGKCVQIPIDRISRALQQSQERVCRVYPKKRPRHAGAGICLRTCARPPRQMLAVRTALAKTGLLVVRGKPLLLVCRRGCP